MVQFKDFRNLVPCAPGTLHEEAGAIHPQWPRGHFTYNESQFPAARQVHNGPCPPGAHWSVFRGAPAALAVIFHSSLPTPQATIESFCLFNQVAPAQPCFKPSRDTFLFSSSLACAPAASGPAHCTSRLSTACPSSQTLASAPCHTRACTSCRWSRRRSVPLH
jgi:hypothetical protein